MSAPQVIVVGSYVQDHAWTTEQFPSPGESRIGTFATGPGGKGFNQAVACHRQGVDTLFIGAIGNDHLGSTAQNFAAGEKLPCAWDVHTDKPTAASTITVNARGENLIVVALGANDALSVDFVQAQQAKIQRARVVLSQLECNLAATRSALTLARSAQVATILNPAPINQCLTVELLALTDILTPNETEFAFLLRHLFRIQVPANYWEADDATLHLLCRHTRVATVVITLGDKGCFVSHADGHLRGDANTYYRVPAESVATVDTTGAGDAFSGGLAAALVRFREQPFATVVHYAGRVAALSTETPGTAPAMPYFEKVRDRFP